MRASRTIREQVVATARLLAERSWVANHDGNITVRIGKDRYLATPTATSKRLVSDALLIEVDGRGKRVSGTARPFSELALHLGIYQSRSDIAAVVHAHPPHATAIACSAGNLLERPFIAEAVVSIGASIPKVPFAASAGEARQALAAVAGDVDAALLENHGAIAWGADLEQAYLRLELVEHLARIALIAQAAGGVMPLPESTLTPLLEKRARAGLGKAAEKAAQPARSGESSPERNQIVRVIREELIRALKD